MSDHGVGPHNESSPNPSPDLHSRINSAFHIENRDWDTVSRRVATRLLALGGAVLALGAAGIAGFRTAYADKIFPKTLIGDVPVGGMTAEEATAAVQRRLQEMDTSTVTYTYEAHSWNPSLTQLGITADVTGAVSLAMQYGRDAKAADRMMATTALVEPARTVPLSFSIDPGKLNAWFDAVDVDLGDPAIDATFTIKDKKLEVTDDSTGTGADRDKVTAEIQKALQEFAIVSSALPVDTWHPRITKADLQANEGEVLNILSNSVTARFEGQLWEIQPEDISMYMIFTSEMENGAIVTHVDFDRTLLAQYLRDRFSDSVNRMPVNARVQFFQGQLTPTSKAQDGIAMKASEFADMVAASFTSNHERVDIPVVVTPAKVREDNLDTLGIRERLCRVDSNYQADLGTERAHNVEVGINLINNTIVAPGEDFSFNRAVGSIDANPDFTGGTGIVAGVIQDEFGGGICQVVTTAFRAAIYAGLPITEWYPHTYRLGGYERDGWGAGFDASILQPEYQSPSEWADLKFTNNTDNFILISSWADNGIHVMEVYGTDPGWDVEVAGAFEFTSDDPPLEDQWVVDNALGAGSTYPSAWPLEGSNFTFTRTVYDASGTEMYTREFVSRYKGRGWQCTCSADMVGVPCW